MKRVAEGQHEAGTRNPGGAAVASPARDRKRAERR